MNDSLEKFMEQLRFRMNVIENSCRQKKAEIKLLLCRAIVQASALCVLD